MPQVPGAGSARGKVLCRLWHQLYLDSRAITNAGLTSFESKPIYGSTAGEVAKFSICRTTAAKRKI